MMLSYSSVRVSAKFLMIFLLVISSCSSCFRNDKKEKQDQQGEAVSSDAEIDLLSLVSVQIPGWQAEKPMVINEARGMRRYMTERESELYCAYGFRRMAVGKFKNAGSLPIVVEIYEFDSSENAYGIFSFDTTGNKLRVGQEAVYGHGILKFWKGKIFVRVVATEEFRVLEKDVLAFGRAIDSRIPTMGSKPSILSLIPGGKLMPDSIHFFHKNICLNNIYYIPESETLYLSEQTDVVTAQYDFGPNQYPRLILIKYPDEFVAKTGFDGFNTAYFHEQTPVSSDQKTNIVRTEDGEYDSITLHRNFVILVFESRSPNPCKQLIDETLVRMGQKEC